MIGQWQIGLLKRHAHQYLSQRGTLEQQAATVDAYGAQSNVWQVVQADLPCRLIRIGNRTGSQVAPAGEQETLEETYRLILMPGVPLDVNQRLTVEGVVYAVIQIEGSLTDAVFASAIITRRHGHGG